MAFTRRTQRFAKGRSVPRRRTGRASARKTSSAGRAVAKLTKEVAELKKQAMAPSQTVSMQCGIRVSTGDGKKDSVGYHMAIGSTTTDGQANANQNMMFIPVTSAIPTPSETVAAMKDGVVPAPSRLAVKYEVTTVKVQATLEFCRSIEVMALLFPAKQSLGLPNNAVFLDRGGSCRTCLVTQKNDLGTTFRVPDGPFEVKQDTDTVKKVWVYSLVSRDGSVFGGQLAKGEGRPLGGWSIEVDGAPQVPGTSGKGKGKLQRPHFYLGMNNEPSRVVNLSLVWSGRHSISTGAYSLAPVFQEPLVVLLAVRARLSESSAFNGDGDVKMEMGVCSPPAGSGTVLPIIVGKVSNVKSDIYFHSVV